MNSEPQKQRLTIRCSELDRILTCNGSLTLVRMVNPRQGSEGDAGTAIHAEVAYRLVKELAANAESPIDASKPVPGNSQWIVDFCFNEVREAVPSDWALEVEAAMAYEFPRFILSGHIDAMAINQEATEAIGWDYKTGYDPVDVAEQNDQMLGYMVLLMRAYPTLTKITFNVVQPRNDEDEGYQRVSSVTIDGPILKAAEASLEARVNAALDNAMEVTRHRKACKWCPASIQCPELIQLREESEMKLTPELLSRIKATPDDAMLADWVIAARTLNRPFEDAEKLADERIESKGFIVASDGTPISIKEEGGSYSYPDPLAFYKDTREILTDDAVYAKTVKPSVTKTIEAIAAVMGLPKTSKKGDSATSVFDAKLRPRCVQGKRKKKVFGTP